MGKYCIGIDLGGTFIKFGLLNERSEPMGLRQLPTPRQGAKAVVNQMVAGAREVLAAQGVEMKDVAGAGIGSPGPLDLDAGVVISLPNIPGMDGCELRKMVGDGLGVPAVLENDANAAAYGEYVCGAGREARDMVMLTLGTGVGSGIVEDGRILHGAHSMGGEIGHMVVQPDGEQCNCGQKGCLERYASATFMAEYARRRVEEAPGNGMLHKRLRESGTLEAVDVHAACRQGDPLAQEIWNRSVYYLAIGCVNICRIFDPDEIVLAGGMVKAGDDLLNPLLEHYRRLHWTLTDVRTTLALASLGNNAGVIGAAALARSTFAG